MRFALDAVAVLGALGVLLSLASFAMKRMLPLRVLAIAANFAFIAFALALLADPGIDSKVPLPGLLLNTVLLPINARRVWEIRAISREIGKASAELSPSAWLLPHMRRRTMQSGEILFRKGNAADRVFYVGSGAVRLVEIDRLLGPGELLGEIGLFTPDKRRTQTVVCVDGGELYEMTDEMLFQLYYQDPKIGFHIVRLIAARLLCDVERQQAA